MADYPSWSDERDAYADQGWSAPAPPPPPSHYGGGGYPGADYAAPDPYAPPPPAPNRGSAGYAGGAGGYENRGSAGFGAPAANTGYAGGAGGFATGAAKANDNISYDTSSRDPAHLRARVFIGSLGRGPIVREDIIELCRPFGPLMAVTLFKQGYAFVQYEQAEDADNACEVLNGKRWKGVNVDVHLAMEGLVRKTLPQKRTAEGAPRGCRGSGMGVGGAPPRSGGNAVGAGGGRGSVGPENERDWPGALSAKRPKPAGTMSEEPYLDINEQNKKAASEDNSTQASMLGTEMADTLICGTCRYVTSDFIAYREHRKKQCVKPKDNLEPQVLRCASCGLRFLSAWKMLFHLTDFHRMQLFKPDYSEEALERAKMEDEKYRALSATRMEAWRVEQEKDQSNHFVVEANPPAAPDVAAAAASSNGAAPAETTKSVVESATAGAGDAAAALTESVVQNGGGAGMERVTTGADYDEDEEDEDDGQPSAIPSLG